MEKGFKIAKIQSKGSQNKDMGQYSKNYLEKLAA